MEQFEIYESEVNGSDFCKDIPLRNQNTSGPPTWFLFIPGTCWHFWTVLFLGFQVIRVH